jgi:hypothetical protein
VTTATGPRMRGARLCPLCRLPDAADGHVRTVGRCGGIAQRMRASASAKEVPGTSADMTAHGSHSAMRISACIRSAWSAVRERQRLITSSAFGTHRIDASIRRTFDRSAQRTTDSDMRARRNSESQFGSREAISASINAAISTWTQPQTTHTACVSSQLEAHRQRNYKRSSLGTAARLCARSRVPGWENGRQRVSLSPLVLEGDHK